MKSVLILNFQDNQGRKYVAAGALGPLRPVDGDHAELLLHETENSGLAIELVSYKTVTDAVVLDEPTIGRLEVGS